MNNFNGVKRVIDRSLLMASDLLTEYLNNNLLSEEMEEVFGSQVNTVFGQNFLTNLLLNDNIWSQIEVRSASDINNALGAFSTTTGKIYLSQEFVLENEDNIEEIAAVVLEEIGHYIDWNLNSTDTSGDEGELFSALVRGINLTDADLSRILAEDDRASITLDGQTIEIEQSATGVSRPKNDDRISTLLEGVKWNNTKITYSFFSGGSYYGGESGVAPVSNKIKNTVRHFLEDVIEPLIDVNFVEVGDSPSSSGQIRYLLSNGPNYAYAYSPSFSRLGGDIHFNPKYDNASGTNGLQGGMGTHGYTTILHETLHALGLKHPGNYNGSGGGEPPFIAFDEDNQDNSVMTYNFKGAKPATPMPYDVLALQYLYGTKSYNDSNTTYKFTSTSGYSDGTSTVGSNNNSTKITVWDSNGFDTFDLSNLKFESSGYRIDLREGGWVTVSDAFNGLSYKARGDSKNREYDVTRYGTRIAFGVDIEKAIGSSSDDTIIGNDSDNSFIGNGGNDTFNGGKGKDVVIYAGDYSQYEITDSNGVFTVESDRYGKDTLKEIETIQFGDRKISLTDAVTTPTPPPTSSLPTLSIDNVKVTESKEGTVNAIFTVSRSGNTDRLIKVDYQTTDGTASAPKDFTDTSGTLTFNPNQNQKTISVVIESDAVVEKDETFFVNLTNPNNATINDGRGQGTIVDNTDTVSDSSGGNNKIEGTSRDDLLKGNSGKNVLRGYGGNDTLDGGSGADTMYGGNGNDSYLVDNSGDVVKERAGEGIDTVSSTVSYRLRSHVENLTLEGSGERANGNSMDNLIVGNKSENRLKGKGGDDTLIGNGDDDFIDGGEGADRLIGGVGNDTYSIKSDTRDVIIEKSNEGFDTVKTDRAYTLPTNVEGLVLTNGKSVAGNGNNLDNSLKGNTSDNSLNGKDGDDTIVGSRGDDELIGSTGNDVLSGGSDDDTLVGGSGKDDLIGGKGKDHYLFNSYNEGADTISGFSVKDDKIAVSRSGFKGLPLGKLDSERFVVGASATKASHRFIYNDDNGDLLFDLDGSGNSSAKKIASLKAGLSLTNQHIVVV